MQLLQEKMQKELCDFKESCENLEKVIAILRKDEHKLTNDITSAQPDEKSSFLGKSGELTNIFTIIEKKYRQFYDDGKYENFYDKGELFGIAKLYTNNERSLLREKCPNIFKKYELGERLNLLPIVKVDHIYNISRYNLIDKMNEDYKTKIGMLKHILKFKDDLIKELEKEIKKMN